MEILKMTALELGGAIREKKITCVQAAAAYLDEIEKTNPAVNAYLTVCREQALKAAEAAQKKIDAGEPTSPLAGVPIAVKDNLCTEGLRTTCASKMLGDFLPPYTATAVKKLEEAGMVILGKTNMDEFAMGSTSETSYFGPTRNPRDLSRVPGGSSGGSAAAVAAAMAPCALGSDTGGSIRQPASYCGVTGFKPTYGTVSRYGLIAYASSLDQIGPLARDTLDCAALTDIIRGADPFDGTSLEGAPGSYLENIDPDIRGKRIALPKQCFAQGIQEEVKEAVLACAGTLRALGATVEEVSLPFYDYVIPAYYIIAAAEASSNLSRFDGVKYGYRGENPESLEDLLCRTRSEGFGEEVKKRILLGTFVLSSGFYDAYYKKALQVKAIIVREFDRVFREYDAILCPTVPVVAPKLGESLKDAFKMYLSDIYTVPANLAGLPGLSVPCGFDREGLPIGVQIWGQRLGEQTVFNIGHAYQQATAYHKA